MVFFIRFLSLAIASAIAQQDCVYWQWDATKHLHCYRFADPVTVELTPLDEFVF